MQRIQYNSYGGPEGMHLETYSPPAPRPGELRIRVKAASVNPVDWQLRQGFMKLMMGNRFPRGMGMDLAGVVDAVGPGVHGFAIGDEILGQTPMNNQNAFSEMAITLPGLIIPKPASLTFAAAAALPTVGLTAWRALLAARLKKGQSILINGAAGGVGQAAVAIAKVLGAVVSVRVGPSSIHEMAEQDFASVLDYSQPIPTRHRHSFDVVFDCHGGLTAREEKSLIKPGGVAVDIVPNLPNLLWAVLSPRHRFVRGTPDKDMLRKVADLAATGQLPLTVSRTSGLSEAIGMIRDLETGKRGMGKAVILLN